MHLMSKKIKVVAIWIMIAAIAMVLTLPQTVAAQESLQLEDGVYKVQGTMVNANLTKPQNSMSNGAINHNIKLTVKDGQATVTMDFNGMNLQGKKGYLGKLSYYGSGYTRNDAGGPNGTLYPATVLDYQCFTDGGRLQDVFGTNYPNHVTFPLISEVLEKGSSYGYVPLQVFVPVMDSLGVGTQDVYLKLDLDNMTKTTDSDPAFQEKDSPVVRAKRATFNGVTYQVSGRSAVVTAANKKIKKAGIPATVTIGYKKYQVTGIRSKAFSGKKQLSSITIGANVQKIGSKAFYQDAKLKTVTLKGTKLKSVGSKAFSGTKKAITFKIPKSKWSKYKKMIKKAGASKKAKYKKA